MSDANLLAALRARQWSLALNRTHGYRCMYWCDECGLWKCVDESGAYHPDPADAITAALAAA